MQDAAVIKQEIKTFLVPYWYRAHTWLSVQCAALVTVLLLLQQSVQQFAIMPGLETLVSSNYYKWAMIALTAMIMLLRLVNQPIKASVAAAETVAVAADQSAPKK